MPERVLDMTSDMPDIAPDMGPWSLPEGMVDIPEGAFTMGTSFEVNMSAGRSGETPVHEVWLSRYAIDRVEVTASEYAKCVSQGACEAPNPGDGPDTSLCTYEVEGKAQHPINCVDWASAQSYCTWVGKHLPTEAQWEKAARGPDGLTYPWGNAPVPSCDYTASDECQDEPGTWLVGTSPGDISPYGAQDLLGNVSEWVFDLFERLYYGNGPYRDPRGPESASSGYRSLRGLSFRRFASYGYSSGREAVSPELTSEIIGFRCAYSGPDGF